MKFSATGERFKPWTSCPRHLVFSLLMSMTAVLASPVCAIPVWAVAETEHVDSEAIDTVRAFRSVRRAAWYDEERHSFAPPNSPPEQDSEIRRSGWLAKPKPGRAARWTNWNW